MRRFGLLVMAVLLAAVPAWGEKLVVKKGSTSKLMEIFISDSSSGTGAGLTGLAYNTAGLTAYYYRSGAASATAITLATMTLGTWATGGFIVVDGTNMPGWYQIGIPDAALATGANTVTIHLKGATNMVPLPIEIQLVDYDPQSATNLGLSNLNATVSSRLAPMVEGRTLFVGTDNAASINMGQTLPSSPTAGTTGAALRMERYAVLADAGNGASSFKTNIGYTLNIPGGGGGSQRWVIRFDATPTCNVAGVIATVSTFNPTTDFLTLVEPLPGGTIPTTGCEFEVVF